MPTTSTDFAEDFGNFSGNCTMHDESLEISYIRDLVQLIIYFHILPVITTILISIMIYNSKKRKTELRMKDHCHRLVAFGFCCYCRPSLEFIEKKHSDRWPGFRMKSWNKSPSCAPDVPAQNWQFAGWNERYLSEGTDGTTNTKSAEDVRTMEEFGKSREDVDMEEVSAKEKKMPSADNENDSRSVSKGTINFRTQRVNHGDIMIEDVQEEKVKIEKVKWDEDPIEFYEIGLDIEDVEGPTVSTKDTTGSSSIMTASIRQITPKH